MEENCQQENDSIFKVDTLSDIRALSKKLSTLWLPFYFPQFEGNKKFQHCFFRISTPSAQSMCTVAWRCWEGAWGGTFCLSFLPTSVAASLLPSSRFFLLSLPGGQAIQALAENQKIAKILIPQQEKDQKVDNFLFPARTQPQSPERTSILIIEAANTRPRFFSRPSQVTETRQKENKVQLSSSPPQVPTSLTHCTVELRIVDEVVGREVCAATTHPCGNNQILVFQSSQ